MTLLKILTTLNIKPNHVTFLGLAFSIVSGYCLGVGLIQLSVIPFVFAGICDVLDGRLARHQNATSLSGALLDSVVDRYSDFCYFFGLSAYFVKQGQMIFAIFAMSAILASVCISYIKARSQSLGYSANVGYWERPERMIVIGFGMLLLNPTMIVVLLGSLAHFTAFKRWVYAYRSLNAPNTTVERIKKRLSLTWMVQTLTYILILVFIRL